jgi:hypothetical protein
MSGFQVVMRSWIVALFVAAFISHSFSQTISISGTVTDNSTSPKPIASAKVKLLKANISTTADANGKFTFQNGTAVNAVSPIHLVSKSRIDQSGFYIAVNKQQNVKLSICNALGKTVYKQAQIMSPGYNFIRQPKLTNGVYVVNITMSSGTYSERFIFNDAGSARTFDSKPLMQSINKEGDITATLSSAFLDTLVISAATYDTVKRAVTNPSESNITIRMSKTQVFVSCGQDPCDPKANSKVKNLLCYLKKTPYLSGQARLDDYEKVYTLTGRYAAILGNDFGYIHKSNIIAETQSRLDWFKSKKGIIHYQWHWICPAGASGQYGYDGDCDFVPMMDNTQSQLYKDIDAVMKELKKFQDAGIPVLFRPIHESNDNYMWWAKKGADAYKKLYKLIRARADLAGLHNILWDFNGMPNTDGWRKPMKDYYPGDTYVDILSGDYDQTATDLKTLQSINSNKIYGVSETFSPINPATEPAFSYFIVWASRDWGTKGVEEKWKTAMKNPKTVSVEQLPDITKW